MSSHEFLTRKGIKSNKDKTNVPQAKQWLEEYAKEVAIGFDKWKYDNKWVASLYGEHYYKDNDISQPNQTREQLYQQYLNQRS